MMYLCQCCFFANDLLVPELYLCHVLYLGGGPVELVLVVVGPHEGREAGPLLGVFFRVNLGHQ